MGKDSGMRELIVDTAELILLVKNRNVSPLLAWPVIGSGARGAYAILIVLPDPTEKTSTGALHINTVLAFQLFTAVVTGGGAPPKIKFRLLSKVTKTLCKGAQLLTMPSTGGGVHANELGARIQATAMPMTSVASKVDVLFMASPPSGI
jgi:hypothetical protein